LHSLKNTTSNTPITTSHIEPHLYQHIRSHALHSPLLIFHEIDGIETHVHIPVTLPPTLLISDWIGKLKGASSHHVNHKLANRKLLDWQTGYGVVSFGTKAREWMVKHIRNQKEHHQKGTTVERLDRITHA